MIESDNDTVNIRNHSRKQSVALGYHLADELLSDGLININTYNEDQMIIYAIVKDIIDDYAREYLVNFFEKSETFRLLNMSKAGALDKIKQSGFYVDITPTGALNATPSTICRSDAEAWLARAEKAVGWLNTEAIAP